MTAQMHVHTTPPALGSAWRPSNSSSLPDVYYMAKCVESMSAITGGAGEQPRYTGSSCSLTSLHDFWKKAIASGENLYEVLGPRWQHYPVNIHLDAILVDPAKPTASRLEVQNIRQPPSSCPCMSCRNRPKQQKNGLFKFLNAMPRPEAEYQILLLGMPILTRWTRPTEEPYTSSHIVAARLGILVVREPLLGDEVWRRVGIASWEAGYGELKPVHEALWNPFQCYLA